MRGGISIIAAVVLLILPVTSQSATVNLATCPTDTSFACVTGIDNLVILGDSYDLTVVVGAFDSLFSDPESQLLSWGDRTFGDAAEVSIAEAMNAVLPAITDANTLFVDDQSFFTASILLHLPAEFGNSGFFSGECAAIRSTGTFPSNCGNWARDERLAFASFTPASIPLPPAAWLFGTALIGLVMFGRRRNAN